MGSEPPPPPKSDPPTAKPEGSDRVDPSGGRTDPDGNPLADIPVGDPSFAIDPVLVAALPDPMPMSAGDAPLVASQPVEPAPAPPEAASAVRSGPAALPEAASPNEASKTGPAPAGKGPFASLSRAVTSASDGLSRAASFGLKFFLPYILAASGFGSALWFFRNPDRLPDAITNKLSKKEQYAILAYCLETLGALFAATLVGVVVLRLVQKRFSVLRTVRFGSAWGFLLLGSAFGATLAIPTVESSHPIFTLQIIGMCAACAGAAVYRGTFDPKPITVSPGGGGEAPRGKTGERLSKTAVVVLLLIGWAGYAIIFSRLSLLNHQGLVTRVTDLGIYDNIFWQSAHGHPLRCTFIKAEYHGSAHFDPILVLLSPLYLIYPRAETILVLQSVWLGSSIVPMYLLGRGAGLDRPTSIVLAFCFLLHPALHGANLYEFHSLTLANPVLLWLLHLLDRGRLRWYYPVLAVTLLIREDMSLLVSFVAISAMIRFDGPRRRAAAITLLVALVYFVAVKLLFMTSADVFSGGNEESYGFTYYYEHMTQSEAKGFAGFLLSFFTNPAFLAWHAFQEPKLQLMATMLLPVAFLPLLSRKGRFVLLYGAIFILLASRGPVFTVHFQYTAVVLPVVFALVPDGLARLRASPLLQNHGWSPTRFARAAVAATIVATLLVSVKFGGILDNSSFKGGFSRVVRKLSPEDEKNWDWVESMLAKIPPDAAVATTDRIGSHVSNRAGAYLYKLSVTKPYQYVFVDEREVKDPELKRFKEDQSCGALVEMGRRGSLALFKVAPRGPACTQ